MEKFLEKLRYFVYDSEASFFDINKGEAKFLVEKLEEENDMVEMYNLVFQDMVDCYIEDRNYNNEIEYQEESNIELSKEEIRKIAYKMIHKNEYLWEIINDTIEQYIEDILEERGK